MAEDFINLLQSALQNIACRQFKSITLQLAAEDISLQFDLKLTNLELGRLSPVEEKEFIILHLKILYIALQIILPRNGCFQVFITGLTTNNEIIPESNYGYICDPPTLILWENFK
jgi:hypothetical protein